MSIGTLYATTCDRRWTDGDMRCRIKLTTAAPHSQTYEGSLFTACPVLNIVAINTRPAPTGSAPGAISQPGDYHIIPVSRIQSFQLLSLPSESGTSTFATAQPPIGPLDVKRLEERERARINKLKEDERNRGKGVTKEAQAIFDSFKRMYVQDYLLSCYQNTADGSSNMPIRWHGQQMVVHDAVIINAPYRPEDCKSTGKNQEVLNRVRKVLEGERKKLKEKEERDRKSAAPAEPRKGG